MSVDQVVANFGTDTIPIYDIVVIVCPSIRLLPTSAPQREEHARQELRVSVDQVVANFGTTQAGDLYLII